MWVEEVVCRRYGFDSWLGAVGPFTDPGAVTALGAMLRPFDWKRTNSSPTIVPEGVCLRGSRCQRGRGVVTTGLNDYVWSKARLSAVCIVTTQLRHGVAVHLSRYPSV